MAKCRHVFISRIRKISRPKPLSHLPQPPRSSSVPLTSLALCKPVRALQLSPRLLPLDPCGPCLLMTLDLPTVDPAAGYSPHIAYRCHVSIRVKICLSCLLWLPCLTYPGLLSLLISNLISGSALDASVVSLLHIHRRTRCLYPYLPTSRHLHTIYVL